MMTAARNLHIYFETDDVTGPVTGRRYYNSLLEEVRTGSHDIVLTFVNVLREDEVANELRKYVPVILIDNEERFIFWIF